MPHCYSLDSPSPEREGGRGGGREGGRKDGYVGRQTWICTIPGLYMHDERERLLLATWPVVLNGRV